MPQEVKGLFDNLQAALATNREKTEALEKQVKKGGEDAVTKAEWSKTSKALDAFKDEINAIYRKVNRPALAQVDAKTAALETKANLEVAKWIGAPGDQAKGAAHRLKYKAVFDKLSRFGKDSLDADEVKTIAAGSGPDGGFYIEPARSDYVIQRLRETSAMRNLASIVTIGKSNSYEIRVDRDDVGYGWVGEQTPSRTATTTPQFGLVDIPVHEMYAMPTMTQNALDDMDIDIEGLVNDKVLNRFGRAENTAFVTGNAVKQPAGFLSQVQGSFVTTADATRAFGALQYKFTGSSGAFRTASATVSPADDLLDLIYSFNAGFRKTLAWAMNRTTLGAVRKIKDQLGNYIYDPRLEASGIVDSVLGYRVEEFADMADFTTSNAFAIAIGDFKQGYQIVDRQGIRQLRDPFSTKGNVLFYTTKRTGGAITNSDAIKVLKFGTS